MTSSPQRVCILGSTGSVGVNTLDVLARHPARFEVFALTALHRVDELLAQCVRYQPRYAVLADLGLGPAFEQKIQQAGLRTKVLLGAQALCEVAAHPEVDTVMAAIVGAAGLGPCLAAARAGKRLLLANKEALVMGGALFQRAVHQGSATLLPIDSEHSAIFQALPQDRALWSQTVDKIILTGSGGPFRTLAPEQLAQVTPEQACRHPNWDMGKKISVDSATMMNKVLEVIEAHYLFEMSPQKIEVVLHPQSVIHSMVQFVDGSVVAQLGTPDMRTPIAYGLSWPQRIESGAARLNFVEMAALTFEAIHSPAHRARYPSLALAWQVLAGPNGAAVVLNAANEVAVQAFLARRLRFDQIYAINAATLEAITSLPGDDLDSLLDLDNQARLHAGALVQKWER